MDWGDANIYTIDIVERVAGPRCMRMTGESRDRCNEKMEWRLRRKNDPWTSYRDSSPQRIGDVRGGSGDG